MSARRLILPPAAALLACSLLTLLGVCALPVTPARAESSCPNEAAREREVHGLGLPDCRSYEQVSPVNKENIDADGLPGVVQASRSGDRVHYLSLSPFGGCQNSDGSTFAYYLSSRTLGGGWSTACISADKIAFSEELLETPLPGRAAPAGFAADEQQLIFESEEQLVEGAVAGAPNVYEQNLEASAGDQLSLVGYVPPAGHEFCSGVECEVSPAGAVAGAGTNGEFDSGAPQGAEVHYTQSAISQDGSRVFFTALPSGRVYLREDGRSSAQVSEGPAVFREATPNGEFAFYTEGEDLYRFDAQTGSSEPVAKPVTATGHGDLTKGSDEITEVAQAAGVFRVGEGLFGAGLKRGTRITAVDEPEHMLTISLEATETLSGDPLTGSPGGVVGVLGASSDGSIVYFAADGVLAENTREYEYLGAQGEHEHGSETAANEPNVAGGFGVANLYEWYQPPTGPATTTFIARLTKESEDDELGAPGDELDWWGFIQENHHGVKTSRVTPGGETLLFASRFPLTGYDNVNPDCTEAVEALCSEFYRYRAGEGGALGRLSCVSCNPDAAVGPRGNAGLNGRGSELGVASEPILTRNLSEDGSRVFFDSPDSLVAGVASNVTSVYEWEAPASQQEREKAENSCTTSSLSFHSSAEGCLFLISSGTQGAYFGDASANGDDVFFFTAQRLAASDDDEAADVYDASVNGEGCGVPGYPECHPEPKPLPQCSSERECEPPPSGPPAKPRPATSSVSGPGNLITPPPARESPHVKTTGKPLTNAKKLTKALKACHRDKRKHKRTVCERAARKKYPVKASKTSNRDK